MRCDEFTEVGLIISYPFSNLCLACKLYRFLAKAVWPGGADRFISRNVNGLEIALTRNLSGFVITVLGTEISERLLSSRSVLSLTMLPHSRMRFYGNIMENVLKNTNSLSFAW